MTKVYSSPELFNSENYLVMDLETTNNAYGDAAEENSLLLAVWRYQGKTYFKWANQYNQDELVQDVLRADFIVAHNAKFELKWLKNCGVDLTKVIAYCTQIGEYVLKGNTSKLSELSLGKTAPRYGVGTKDPYVDKMMKKGVCPSELPKSLVKKRCIKDVQQTHEIFKQQQQRIKDLGLLSVMYTRCLFTPCLADIEFNGMQLDHDRVNDEYYKIKQELDDVTRTINQVTGGVNPNSPKQMAEFLYKTLGFKPLKDSRGNDIISASADVLQRLKPKNQRQRRFLELKQQQSQLNAWLTKSLTPFKKCVDDDAILRAQFNQTVTKTHRLSSSGTVYGVQFQNMPRVYKTMFCPRYKGWSVAEIDGAQLEFRVAAYCGQDPVAYNDIVNDVDVHSVTAQVITEAGQDTDRQTAKAHTFKPLFGGFSGTDAEKAYYKAFQEKYSGVAKAQEQWVQQALMHKQLRLESGLITYWPECKRNRTGYIEGSSKIYNLPIQSLATAEIIPVAVLGLWHELKRRNLKSFIVNTVHDSAILEVHPDEVLEVQDIAVRCFAEFVYNYLYDIYNIKFNVPLGTGLKVGNHWNEPDKQLSSYLYSNGTFLHCAVMDKDELKYTPECPFEFEEAA